MEICEKNKKIDDVTAELKKEFVGIDEQIDSIMSNLRAWYMFPELQERPLVINLWGMTGVGKTSLVKAIVNKLGMDEKLMYFNFAEINEMTSRGVIDEIEDNTDADVRKIFVYDEFQYAATLDKGGNELKEVNGLKPFWELLDTGVLQKSVDFYDIANLRTSLYYIGKMQRKVGIKLKNGFWMNPIEGLSALEDYELNKLSQYISVPGYIEYGDIREMAKQLAEGNESDEPLSGSVSSDIPMADNHERSKKGTLLGYSTINSLKEIYSMIYHTKFVNEYMNNLYEMDINELIEELQRVERKAKKSYPIDFKESVIFVLGNLDEAYKISFNTNPDMSPDQFHKISKKISIVDIKKALQERFRNEQIARLGNIHLIYPAFSSNSFKKIISMEMEKYAVKAKEMTGYDVEYENSIKNIIYKDSVFPTHGTRPIFSTVHEIIKTKLPIVVSNIATDGLVGVTKLKYSFRGGKTVVSIYNENGDFLKKYSFKEVLRVNSLRKPKKNDEQSLTAVHESGHFVVYAYLTGKMPEKLCSVAASSNALGFMMMDNSNRMSSYHEMKNQICIALGGYWAEGLTFGHNMITSGASEDLREVTAIASDCIRNYGMGNHNYVTTYGKDAVNTDTYRIINEDDQSYINNQIVNIITECNGIVDEILKKPSWNKMLKDSATYLSQHATMPQEKMQELYDAAVKGDSDYCVINNTDFYKNIVSQFAKMSE